MPRGGKRTGSGRRKGIPNKSTQEIRELITGIVDFEQLVRALERRAKRKSELAARLLFEYAYGKPKEPLPMNGDTNPSQIAESFAQMVSSSGAGRASSRDPEVQE